MMGKLATNDEAMTTHFIQYAGIEVMRNKAATEKYTADLVEELRKRRDVLVSNLKTVPGFDPHTPKVTFYLFTNCTKAVKLTGAKDAEEFRYQCFFEFNSYLFTYIYI
jgi:aspartate/methionine/tyrosine aminotransferase